MKLFFRYMKHYKVQSILAPLFKMLEAVFELLVPLVVARMIDSGIANHDRGELMKMGLLLLLLCVVGLMFSVTAQYFAAYTAMHAGQEIRANLFSHIQSLSHADLDRAGTSTLITRMTSDVTQVQSGINMMLRLFLRSPFIVVGAVVMAFLVDVKSALIFLIVLPVLSVVVFFIVLHTVPMYRTAQKKLDRLTLLSKEGISGVRVIRAFHREEKETEAFTAETDELFHIQKRVGRLSMLMNPASLVIVNLGIAMLIYYGGIRITAGTLTQGQVVALVNYMSQILVELVKFANLIVIVSKATASAKRVEEVMEIVPSMSWAETNPALDESAPLVSFRNAGLTYAGDAEPSLSGISVDIKRGETLGVIGGTGAGKSTLVHMIPRFYDATEGEVDVCGADVKNYPKETLRKKIGLVPQHAVLFKGTVRENMLEACPDASDTDIWEALADAQADFVKSLDGGLDHVIARGGGNLSGGQRQRLTIARALIRKPEILILDDSASALDFATDAALRKSLRKHAADRATIIVSQRVSAIRQADRILVLDNGVPAGLGSHEELLKKSDVYREIVDSQEKEA